MKRVYIDNDPLMVEHLRYVLEERGIVCIVRNTHFNSIGLGGLYPTENRPELLVEDDHDAPAAERLISEITQAGDADAPDWDCSNCGERIEGQFDACWCCGGLPPS